MKKLLNLKNIAIVLLIVIITFQTAVDEDWEIIKDKYNEILR